MPAPSVELRLGPSKPVRLQHSQASPPALPLATVIVSMARFPRHAARTAGRTSRHVPHSSSEPRSSPGPSHRLSRRGLQQVPAGAQRPAQTPSYSAPKQVSRSRCSTTNIVADGSDKSGEASADYGSYRSRPWTRPGSPAGPDRLIDRARTPARKQPTQPDSPTGAASTQIVPEASRRAGPASGPDGTIGAPSAYEPESPGPTRPVSHAHADTRSLTEAHNTPNSCEPLALAQTPMV